MPTLILGRVCGMQETDETEQVSSVNLPGFKHQVPCEDHQGRDRGFAGSVWLRSARHMVGRQAGFLLLYSLVIQFLGVFIGIIAQIEWNLIFDPDPSHRTISYILDNADVKYGGIINMMSGLCGLVFLILMRRRQIADGGPGGIFHRSEHRMTWTVFLGCCGLLLTAQMIASAYQVGLEWTTSLMGFQSIRTTSEAIQEASGTVPMFIYTCFLAPIVEEMVFRGAILNALKPYGRVFAIITSAVLFGFFHGDLDQGLFAFCVGLVLGYLASEYSIVWSILLHITNNLVLGDVLDALSSQLSSNMSNYLGIVGILACILATVIVLYLGRHRIWSFINTNRSYRNIYTTWANPLFLLFLALEGVSMIYLLLG